MHRGKRLPAVLRRLCGEKKRQKDEVRMQNAGIRGSVISNQESVIAKKKKKPERRTGTPDSSFIILHSAFALRFHPVYAGKRKGRRMKLECRMQGSGDQGSGISHRKKK